MKELPALENEALVLDLVEWLAKGARPYSEVMDAWRTSCPRLPIWEDAVRLGFLSERRAEGGLIVYVTSAGRDFLHLRGRSG